MVCMRGWPSWNWNLVFPSLDQPFHSGANKLNYFSRTVWQWPLDSSKSGRYLYLEHSEEDVSNTIIHKVMTVLLNYSTHSNWKGKFEWYSTVPGMHFCNVFSQRWSSIRLTQSNKYYKIWKKCYHYITKNIGATG